MHGLHLHLKNFTWLTSIIPTELSFDCFVHFFKECGFDSIFLNFRLQWLTAFLCRKKLLWISKGINCASMIGTTKMCLIMYSNWWWMVLNLCYVTHVEDEGYQGLGEVKQGEPSWQCIHGSNASRRIYEITLENELKSINENWSFLSLLAAEG